tara:strand:+ start:1316 stop:1504 length:189 start_codon:yes stop_codon:yes gene_type:complete
VPTPEDELELEELLELLVAPEEELLELVELLEELELEEELLEDELEDPLTEQLPPLSHALLE